MSQEIFLEFLRVFRSKFYFNFVQPTVWMGSVGLLTNIPNCECEESLLLRYKIYEQGQRLPSAEFAISGPFCRGKKWPFGTFNVAILRRRQRQVVTIILNMLILAPRLEKSLFDARSERLRSSRSRKRKEGWSRFMWQCVRSESYFRFRRRFLKRSVCLRGETSPSKAISAPQEPNNCPHLWHVSAIKQAAIRSAEERAFQGHRSWLTLTPTILRSAGRYI